VTQKLREDNNWAAYEERYQIDKVDKVDTAGGRERIETVNSRVGVPTVKVMSSNGKWVFLHSSVDPVKEAQKIAAGISTDPGKVVVVYGFALGYLIEALLEKVDERNPLFIIEPDQDLFCEAMRARDLRHLISSERIYILVGDSANKIKGTFSRIFNVAKYNDVIMTGLMGHQSVYPDSFSQSMVYIKEVVNGKLLSLVTVIKMGSNFVTNSLYNLADYCTHPGVNSLFQKFEGLPAIIVSAGPSLNKNIHLIKEAKGKAVIIAVGTAVKALKKWDIEPDFIFSIDPHPLNYEHFKGVELEEAALIAEIQSNHMIFENFQGPIFVSGDVAILKWFEDVIEKKGIIESGGSVANNAFVAAYKMGADPIILVGQDLAYARDGHSHAAGTNYEEKVYSGNVNLDFFYVKANDGGQLLTDRAFDQFRTFFELWISQYPKREYVNATEGGAFIKGTKLMTLREVIDQYCQKTVDVQSIIREAQQSVQVSDMELVLEKLELRIKDTNAIIAEANRAIKRLKQLEKACETRQSRKMQQYLTEINKIYEKFEADPYIREVAEWFVLHQVHGVLSRTYAAEYSDEDNFHAAIADYSLYYRKVIEGSKAVEKLLQRCNERIRRNTYNG
jgi:hypothetical protein